MNTSLAEFTEINDAHARLTVEVTVNGRPVRLPRAELTGLEIKQAAIAQGVPIQVDFVLQLELPNGNSRIIGDRDRIKVRPHERFTCIANDDNS